MSNLTHDLPNSLQRADKLQLLALLEEKARRKAENKLRDYRAYAKQQEFHANGRLFRERLLMAGNQLGKTWSAGFETAMHLTGRYPDWWQGRTFDKAVAGWAAGVTSEVTRDSVQRVLCGRINAIGLGAIPKDAIKEKAMKRGVADAIDTLVIRHGGGGDVPHAIGAPHLGARPLRPAADQVPAVAVPQHAQRVDVARRPLGAGGRTIGEAHAHAVEEHLVRVPDLRTEERERPRGDVRRELDMRLARDGAQLQHVAQHGDAPPAGAGPGGDD